MTSIGVKSHAPDVTCSHRHWASGCRTCQIDLDPDNEIDDGGKLRCGQRINDSLKSGRTLRWGESAHDR